MFIRLTRTDGLPIWVNASFVVTVEPTRSGGSVVVPIGDGFDYDVQEAPETVLALLGNAPAAKVVAVPQPRLLTPQPDDVSPDFGHRNWRPEEEEKEAEGTPPPAKKRGRKAGAASKKAKGKEQNQPSGGKPQSAPPLPEGFDEIVAEIKKRKCRTARRIRNAIKSFFGKTDDAEIDRILEAMINSGHILIGDDGHVTWTDSSDLEGTVK